MITIALAGLVGFAIGVAAMAGYGYSVAFLTLVQEEKRAMPPSSTEPGK